MGLTSFINLTGLSKKDTMTHELERYGSVKVLKCAIVRGVYYGACESAKHPGEVWAIVCLVKTRNAEFSFKDMDETMGPYFYDCPKSILDMLTPTTSEWANAWRSKCRERIESGYKTIAQQLNALPIGTRIFANGVELVKSPAAYQFKTPFWFDIGSRTYVPKTRIKEFKLIQYGSWVWTSTH